MSAIGQGIERTDNALLEGYCKDALRFRWLLTRAHPEEFWFSEKLSPDDIRALIDEAMNRVIETIHSTKE